LIAYHRGLTVQRIGFIGFMMTSRIDTRAALGVNGIAKSILVLRDQNVLLDRDLAALYGVTTKRLNEQVKRNLARFPIDFMFQLTAEEETALRSHFSTSKKPAANRGGRPEVERAMGIEPTRAATPNVENKLFCAMTNAKCD
jgi:ORF6N domain